MKSKLKANATLTIHGAGNMTKEKRKNIADWLRQQAKELLKYADEYSPRFTARYYY